MEIKSRFMNRILSRVLTNQIRKKMETEGVDIYFNSIKMIDENQNDQYLHLNIDVDVDISKKDLEDLIMKELMK